MLHVQRHLLLNRERVWKIPKRLCLVDPGETKSHSIKLSRLSGSWIDVELVQVNLREFGGTLEQPIPSQAACKICNAEGVTTIPQGSRS
jgi:hypothetical protein